MTANALRDSLIDKLLTISNKNYLTALNHLVEKGADLKSLVELTDEQIAILRMSDKDMESGRLITNNDLNTADLLWLKDL